MTSEGRYSRFIKDLKGTGLEYDAKVAEYVGQALTLRLEDIPLVEGESYKLRSSERTTSLDWTPFLTYDLAGRLKKIAANFDGDMEVFALGRFNSKSKDYEIFLNSLPFRQRIALSNSINTASRAVRGKLNSDRIPYRPATINDFRDLHKYVENRQVFVTPSVDFISYVFNPIVEAADASN